MSFNPANVNFAIVFGMNLLKYLLLKTVSDCHMKLHIGLIFKKQRRVLISLISIRKKEKDTLHLKQVVL